METMFKQGLYVKSIFLFMMFFGLFLHANESLNVQLLWKNQFEFAGFYMAKEKGFYKAEGLDVSLKEFDFSVHIVDDVLSGKADFGVGQSSVVLEALQGKKVVLLNALFQHSPRVLLSKKRADLQTIKDFKNKKIMLDSDLVSTATFSAMMQRNGIKPSDYTILQHSFNVDSLVDGTTDLMTVYRSNEPYELKKRGIDFTLFDPADYGFDMYANILFTSQEYLQIHPQIVKKFQKATLKGWEYAFSHIGESVDVILEKYNTQHKSREALLYEAKVLQKLAYDKSAPFATISPLKIYNIANIYRLLGMTNAKDSALEGVFYKQDTMLDFLKNPIFDEALGILLALIILVIILGFYKQLILKRENIKLEALVEELAKQKKTFKALYDHSRDGIALLDMQSNFTDVNPAYSEMTGFTYEELLKKSCLELTVEEDIEKSRIAMQEVLEVGFIQNFQKRCRVKGNKVLNVNMSMTHLQNPEQILISVRDVTHEEEIKAKLLDAKKRAEEANLEKSSFLANMSHEIRTPMNGIIGLTHLVLQSNLDEKQKNYLQKIDDSAKLLLEIINDILDLSKIEAKKLELEKRDFTMYDILTSVENLLSFKAQEKGLDFQIDCLCECEAKLHGDSLRISQILINLLNNAIKFTDKGFVKLHILYQDMLCRFEVTDSGIGMTQEQQEKLFQAFIQADVSTTRKYGGTGLGLNISKHLVELMHGKIWVESEYGRGSKFIVEIPLEEGTKTPQAVEEKKYTEEDLKAFAGTKILLVEDNKTNQLLILGLLDESELEIDIANNGQEAVDMFRANSYALILMDIQMPVMNGYEATAHIRAQDQEIPIIALTANAMSEDIAKTKEAGMNTHLGKPLDMQHFYKTLFQFLTKGEK